MKISFIITLIYIPLKLLIILFLFITIFKKFPKSSWSIYTRSFFIRLFLSSVLSSSMYLIRCSLISLLSSYNKAISSGKVDSRIDITSFILIASHSSSIYRLSVLSLSPLKISLLMLLLFSWLDVIVGNS